MIFNLSLKDFFDILIVSIFLYLILYFVLRKKYTIFVVFGIFFWYLIFFFSSQFNLFLTNFIFKWFISFGLLFVLILIFIQEIRDFFYFSGTFGFNIFRYFKEKTSNISESSIEIITDAVKEMSEKRIGALIVIEGKDNIDEFVSSGYLLDGFISKPLILSIFDPTSPGHDGAMIIRNNKIYEFAVHLPLSKNSQKTKDRGLRHRAGLGITEVSDSTVIIVSEETGNISLARKGEIENIKDIFELKEKLLNLDINKNNKKNSRIFTIFQILSIKNILIFLASFIISLGLFFAVNTDYSLVQKTFIVPIEFINVPPNLIVKEFKPTELTVTLKGQKIIFGFLSPNDLKVTIDLKNYEKYSISKWNSVLIEDENVNIKIPKNLNLVSVSPSNIRFYLEKIEEPKTQ
jgi:diadenylate cyclase